MEAFKEAGMFFLTGLIGIVAYFLRALKDDTDRKISSLFDMANKQREDISHLRERLARLEK